MKSPCQGSNRKIAKLKLQQVRPQEANQTLFQPSSTIYGTYSHNDYLMDNPFKNLNMLWYIQALGNPRMLIHTLVTEVREVIPRSINPYIVLSKHKMV